MAPLFVSSEFLENYEVPPLPAGAKYFAVAFSEFRELDDGTLFCSWSEDRTRVTDSPTLAVAWALMLASISDDGTNPHPLSRITAFAVDPTDTVDDGEGRLPGEEPVMFVTPDGDVCASPDDEFATLSAQTSDWSKIVKMSQFASTAAPA
jgi:hypothetical protein